MNIPHRHLINLILLAVSINFAWVGFSSAQDQPASQDNASKPLSQRELKKRQKQLAKELGPQDKIWLNDEVPDIITPEERRAFLELSTNEEREQFIELFWDKRNPDTSTAIRTAL